MNIVIYARFSSHSQNEQSIEGQLKVCYDFAKNQGYTVINEYIDRAISGTNAENRPEFLKMIEDSNKGQFDGVLVYQLDRFARNRYDSATYKARLKKNGVRVYSARENITDDASGILVEGLLESMAEYYSAELSQKVKRGLGINAQKGLCTGGQRTLGYRTGEDKKYHIDEQEAVVVQTIFNMYAKRHTVAEINKHLNNLQIKTAAGNQFNKNSLRTILKNQKYIGIYNFNGVTIKDGIPRIIDDDIFNDVQAIMNRNRKAPGSARAKDEYILTTKVFCGHCKEMIRAYSGTSETGRTYSYYACKNMIAKKCDKKKHKKLDLESQIIMLCREQLNTKNINKIAKEVVKYLEAENNNETIKQLTKKLKHNEYKRNNLTSAIIECGNELVRKNLYEQVPILEDERTEIQALLDIEKLGQVTLTEVDIKFFLTSLKKGNVNDLKYRKMLINVLVNKIFLYDNSGNDKKTKIIILFNTSKKVIELTEEDINMLEKQVEKVGSSFVEFDVPPNNP
ncbi:MAG: recombinase family protein [Clostridia bacterium]